MSILEDLHKNLGACHVESESLVSDDRDSTRRRLSGTCEFSMMPPAQKLKLLTMNPSSFSLTVTAFLQVLAANVEIGRNRKGPPWSKVRQPYESEDFAEGARRLVSGCHWHGRRDRSRTYTTSARERNNLPLAKFASIGRLLIHPDRRKSFVQTRMGS